jgi:hypothetical protein
MKALTMLLLTMMFQTSYSQGISSDRVGAAVDSANFAKKDGGNIFSGAQNATDFRASDSVTAATVTVSGVTRLATSLTGTLRGTSGAISASASDTVGLASALNLKLNIADTTDQRTYSNSLYLAKSAIRTLFFSAIDSVGTTDTLYLGAIYPAATIDTIRFDAMSAVSLTGIIQMVDSLTQTTGMTAIDTIATTISRTLSFGASITSTTLTNSKLLRIVFPTVGTVPKHFVATILGHH